METNKITYIQIERYLKGDLDEKAMHQLERQALDDPFLADAIEGFAHAETSSDQHLSILQRQLHQRIAHKQEKKNEIHFTWQRISIAAAASLMFISASILFWMKGSQNEFQTRGSEKEIEVVLANPDDINRSLKPEIRSDGNLVNASASGRERTDSSEPIIGWSGYEAYLQKESVLFLASDKVVITFDVNQEGQLENLKVSEGLNSRSEDEALKMIKDGPKWKGGSKITRIRIKFN